MTDRDPDAPTDADRDSGGATDAGSGESGDASPAAGPTEAADPRAVAARRRVLSEHRETVAGVLAAAEAVAGDWPEGGVADRTAVAGPLERELDRRGLSDRLLDVLVDAVDATGEALSADPVPAPPYLVVTGTGPILRAGFEEWRLVVAVRAFAVERGDRPRYVHRRADPETALSVAVRD